jgi:ferredoxin--NADP+ reductase
MDESPYNATLVERRDVGTAHAIVRLQPDDHRVRAFTPGQFVTVGLTLVARSTRTDAAAATAIHTRLVKRAYSIASSPLESESYELFLTEVPQGRLTPELWKLRPGDRCWVNPEVHGKFTLERVPRDAHLVLVATGTGVAPYVSMLRTHAGDERWRRAVLIHGARTATELGYRAELDERARLDPLFAYVPLLSRETDEAEPAMRGRVQAALEPETFLTCAGFALDPSTCHVLLCGNPAMIQDVRALLEVRGFSSDSGLLHGNVHCERYW